MTEYGGGVLVQINRVFATTKLPPSAFTPVKAAARYC